MKTEKGYLSSANPEWVYEVAPKGEKVSLLTIGGMQTTGLWDGEYGFAFIAYAPLLKGNKFIERFLKEHGNFKKPYSQAVAELPELPAEPKDRMGLQNGYYRLDGEAVKFTKHTGIIENSNMFFAVDPAKEGSERTVHVDLETLGPNGEPGITVFTPADSMSEFHPMPPRSEVPDVFEIMVERGEWPAGVTGERGPDDSGLATLIVEPLGPDEKKLWSQINAGRITGDKLQPRLGEGETDPITKGVEWECKFEDGTKVHIVRPYSAGLKRIDNGDGSFDESAKKQALQDLLNTAALAFRNLVNGGMATEEEARKLVRKQFGL